MKYPPCLGEYARRDPECNGSRRGETEEERTPCAVRNQCVAFQRYCKPEDAGKSGFDSRLQVLIADYGIKNGRVTRREGPERYRPPPPPNDARRAHRRPQAAKLAARRGAARKRRERATAVAWLTAWFCSNLKTRTGRQLVERKAQAKPGDLFLVKRKSYTVVSVLDEDLQTGVPICRVYGRPRWKALDIHIKGERIFKKGDRVARDHARDTFPTKAIGLGSGGLGLVAQRIAKAIESGKIRVPGRIQPPGALQPTGGEA